MMSLIDLYVQEVGEHLPEKMRVDLEKEIRSMIEDSLDDLSRKQGKPVDEEMVVEVLQKLGSPKKFAASYLPPRYLIGPELYPVFISALKLGLVITGILAVIGLGASLGMSARTPMDIPRVAGETLLGFMQAIFQAFAVITLVFACIQWSEKKIHFKEYEKWNPRDMKPAKEEEKIHPIGELILVFFNILVLWVFNLHPEWIGGFAYTESGWSTYFTLAPAFSTYLPWINLILILDTALKIYLVSRMRWQPATRWLSIGLKLLGIVLGICIIQGPALILLNPDTAVRLGWVMENQANLVALLDSGLRVVIGISIAANLIDILKCLYRLLLKGRNPIEAVIG
jgi:hypothetical protein